MNLKVTHAILFFLTQQPLVGRASALSSRHDYIQADTPHSVGLLRTRDQPETEASTWENATLKRGRYPCRGGIRIRIPSKRVATDPHLRPRGHYFRNILSKLARYLLGLCKITI